jgi:hypothetical protein
VENSQDISADRVLGVFHNQTSVPLHAADRVLGVFHNQTSVPFSLAAAASTFAASVSLY